LGIKAKLGRRPGYFYFLARFQINFINIIFQYDESLIVVIRPDGIGGNFLWQGAKNCPVVFAPDAFVGQAGKLEVFDCRSFFIRQPKGRISAAAVG